MANLAMNMVALIKPTNVTDAMLSSNGIKSIVKTAWINVRNRGEKKAMKPKTDKLEIRLVPPELHKAIKDLAHEQGISMNKWLLAALERAVEAKEGK